MNIQADYWCGEMHCGPTQLKFWLGGGAHGSAPVSGGPILEWRHYNYISTYLVPVTRRLSVRWQ